MALPATPEVAGRRGKRKRAAASSGSNTRARRGGTAASGPSPRSNRRVNSRTVEDRNQQTISAFPINAALVEQILASVTSLSGPLRGTGQVTFGMSEDGRPHIRMIRPHGGGGMVGVMEMFLPDDDGSPGGGLPAGLVRRGTGAAASATAGRSSSSPTRTARVRFTRAPRSGSRRLSGNSTSGSVPPRSGPAAFAAAAAASTRPASAGGSARSASASASASNSAFASLLRVCERDPGAARVLLVEEVGSQLLLLVVQRMEQLLGQGLEAIG